MDEDDAVDDTSESPVQRPIARGIALCLGKLADEAAEFGLHATSMAIRQAVGTCLVESAGLEDLPDCRMH